MSNVYKRVMVGSSVAAAMAATGWLVAAAISLSDGVDGIEVPRWLSTAGVMIIVCGTVIGGGAWLVAHSARDAAERHIRPLVQQEIERALTDVMPLMVATLAESMDRRIVPQMHEIVEDALRRAVVGGHIAQLHVNGEALGKTALRSVSTYMSTSRGD